MVSVLGYDIGGANSKACFVNTQDGVVSEFRTDIEYFPFWKQDASKFVVLLQRLKRNVSGHANLDCISVTLTAELSDFYRTKREGVTRILDAVNNTFIGTPVYVLDVNGNFRSVASAKLEPLAVASANWAATGWMVAQTLRDCVVIDVGSTSTSIVPVKAGKTAAKGKTDLEKLINGELVYTGSLRTNVATIVNSVPIRGKVARVSSELFAQSGDVHLLLGHIKEEDYTTETADCRAKKPEEALARLARVVCADTEMLSEKETLEIAAYVYEQQIDQIANGLTQVYKEQKPNAKRKVPAVVTGLGKDFLAKKAAEKAGIAKIIDIDELLPKGAALASPAAGVAFMAATGLEGRRLEWKL